MSTKLVSTQGLSRFLYQIKQLFLSGVSYDTTNKKLVFTKNGSNTDIVALSTIKTDLELPTSESAASGGTTLSLVTTGEKYTWNNMIPTSAKGANSGVCPLDSSGLVDSSYLPAYVDDVVEAYPLSGVTELSAGWLSLTPSGSALTPETGKIYILMADSTNYAANTQLRWSGSTYVEIIGGGYILADDNDIDAIFTTSSS